MNLLFFCDFVKKSLKAIIFAHVFWHDMLR